MKILFRLLLLPICYWQLKANPDGSTRKLQVDGCGENGSWPGRDPHPKTISLHETHRECAQATTFLLILQFSIFIPIKTMSSYL